jgi:hypothetical protein
LQTVSLPEGIQLTPLFGGHHLVSDPFDELWAPQEECANEGYDHLPKGGWGDTLWKSHGNITEVSKKYHGNPIEIPQ